MKINSHIAVSLTFPEIVREKRDGLGITVEPRATCAKNPDGIP